MRTRSVLQSQLVQKEKLASLGNLVAGAAHDIDIPLKRHHELFGAALGAGAA